VRHSAVGNDFDGAAIKSDGAEEAGRASEGGTNLFFGG